ncbi:uncharacterized protein LOC111272476 isoform X3 [Varroa jacobsoni]|uniref:uncharacterized protein LOC111272476 isoform X3 n=1 Tax=Varroa jacobsoni TaxID=62625 RepID=UPI000BF6D327|nr:uncharacterized protein LOC111272476 isoform X3 [Varroa jacobsoni]
MCCVPIFSGAKNIVLVRQMHGSVHATVKRCHPRHANDPELWMSQFYMADFVRRFNDVRPSCSRPGASDPRKQTGCAPLLEMHWLANSVVESILVSANNKTCIVSAFHLLVLRKFMFILV